MGINKDNSGKCNGGGTHNNQQRGSAEETMAVAMVTGSGNNCNNGNEASGNGGKGWLKMGGEGDKRRKCW